MNAKVNRDEIKPVKLTDNDTGKTYTLEFSRAVIRDAEDNGFDITKITDKPMSVYDLFYYAFLKNHPNIDKDYTDGLIDNVFGGVIGIPKELLTKLGELYAKCFKTLSDEERAEKNAKITLVY